ncbi:MAG TPA: beta-galactosidase, partial [Terriglobia bacterium]|nr:beta-galactosidase [Terriglobia bacterium]
MGRVNFGEHLIDRKGITERVSLRGVTLMDWEVYSLPMTTAYLDTMRARESDHANGPRFFSGTFTVTRPGDTYLDMSWWSKGVVWVNGHNLGRYWDRGPQQRLFLPGPWLKRGQNRIVIMDLFGTQGALVKGVDSLSK